jgi:hypothetical protein
MRSARLAALALLGALLVGACEGGDATPTDAGNGVPVDPDAEAHPERQLDPADALEEPDPGDPPPDADPDVERGD